MRNLGLELRATLRALTARRGFALSVVLTLGLGIGASIAVFAALSAALLAPPDYLRAERLVVVESLDESEPGERQGLSGPDFFDLRARSTSFAALTAAYLEPLTLTADGSLPRRVEQAAAAHNALRVLGAWRPLSGRWFTAEEDLPGGAPVAVVAEALWRAQLGADPAAVGSPIVLDGVAHTVVGVMPAGFPFPRPGVEVWRPLAAGPETFHRRASFLEVVARLRPGTSPAAARDEVAAIGRALAREHPETNTDRVLELELLQRRAGRDVRLPLIVLHGAVLAMLLIACANATALMLARGVQRAGELAVRGALGAGRARLLRLALLEAALLAAAATVAGAGLAALLLAVLPALGLASLLPAAADLRIDARILLYALGLAVATAAATGTIPAWRAVRTPPAAALGGGRSSGGRTTGTWQRSLVVIQIALALALLVGGSLLTRSFLSLTRVDPGFDPERLLATTIQLPESRYPTDMRVYPRWSGVLGFYDELLPRVAALPGVRSVALAAEHPLATGWFVPLTVAGSTVAAGEPANLRAVGAGYAETLGLEPVAGRSLSPRDGVDAPMVAVVSRSLAERRFRDRAAIGTEIEVFNARREVVGVVSDVRSGGIHRPPPEVVYLPLHQAPSEGFHLLVRTTGDPLALADAVRAQVAAIDPELAVFEIEDLGGALAVTLARPRFQALMMSGFGFAALALSVIGVASLQMQAVQEGRREIGIRMALGARPGDVFRAVLRRGAALVLGGVVLGVLASLVLGRSLRALLFGVGPTDPLSLALACGVLAATALAASCLPARRAARQDPAATLRAD